MEWIDEVIDIREQFPLLSKTIEIVSRLAVKHANVQGVTVVMTTDFMITIKTSQGLMD
ncbi:TnsA endonuclease N-terminal domain-containing protein [Rossellomorea aquimaris]|nr:TnsA endonuclease N-terminal domain-containing protein [Rossellomorea aquimaris]